MVLSKSAITDRVNWNNLQNSSVFWNWENDLSYFGKYVDNLY